MKQSGMLISRRRVVTAALLAVPLAGLGRLALNEGVEAADVSVNIMNFTFIPTPLTIPVGTTVVWTNQDTAPHTATSDPGSAFTFDTGMLQKGQSGRITFNQAGSFPYHCTVHPNMHGMVVVTGGTGTTAAPSSSTTGGSTTGGSTTGGTTTSAPAAPAAPPAPPPTVAPPPAAPRTGGGDEAHIIRRLGDG